MNQEDSLEVIIASFFCAWGNKFGVRSDPNFVIDSAEIEQ